MVKGQDLTKSYPASVKEKMFGIVQLKRAIDKGKAKVNGVIGEYHYDCPMDAGLFAFLGIDAQALLDIITKAENDAAIEAYVRPFVEKKSAAELDKWNENWLNYLPEAGSESEKHFLELRNKVAPTRKDVRSWPDLLDLDEKRQVPQRVAA